MIECKTYRYFPHTSDDDDKSYRTREEVEEAKTHDAIHGFETYLVDHGVADEDGIARVRAAVKEEIDAAITAAWEADDPLPGTALRHVFADPAPSAEDGFA